MKKRIKKNKSLTILIVTCLTISKITLAQYNIDNQSTVETGGQTHDACQAVNLLPGYEYTGVYGNNMDSYIQPAGTTCDVTYIQGGAGYTGSGNGTPPTLNTNNIVGTTKGSFNVLSDGSSTYSIQLTVPPGTMGMEPALSLVYNSNSGNGLLGTGWSLSGLSAITRTSQNVYDDGQIFPMTLNQVPPFNTDRYQLDGNRLVLTNGTYGADGSEYQTENETFQLVTAHVSGSTTGGPTTFTVETKDGHILEYGDNTTYNAGLIATGTSSVMTWYLDKITDSRGNYTAIHYIQDATTGESRPDYIEYTGNENTGLTPYNKIQFNYSTRADQQQAFIAGSLVSQTMLLTSITMYAKGVFAHEYILNYSIDPLYSHLVDVSEYGSDYSQYNSTKINWHNNLMQQITKVGPSGEPGITFSGNLGITENVLLIGDLNGDGTSDIVQMIPSTPDGNSDVTWSTYNSVSTVNPSSTTNSIAFAATGNTSNGNIVGNLSTNYYGTWGYENSTYPPPSDVENAGNGQQIGGGLDDAFIPMYGYNTSIPLFDINGDGKNDMVIAGAAQGVDEFQFFLNNNGSFNSTPTTTLYGGVSVSGTPFETAIGDFDGDGKADLAVYYPLFTQLMLYSSKYGNIESFKMPQTWWNSNDINGVPDNILMMYGIYAVDINGDGKNELLITALHDYYIINLNPGADGSGIGTVSVLSDNSSSSIFGASPNYNVYGSLTLNNFPCSATVYTGDFNGDGRTDILIYNNFGSYPNFSGGSNWYIGYSNGRSDGDAGFNFYSASNIIPDNGPAYGYQFTPNYQYGRHQYYVADFNGDGKTDIVDQSYTINPGTYTTVNGYNFQQYSAMNIDAYFSTGNTSDIINGNAGGFVHYNANYPNSSGTLGPMNPTYLGDFNGDGHLDLLYYGQGQEPDQIITFDLNNQADGGINKAIAITDGLNVTTDIYYDNLPDLGYVGKYSEGNTAQFPVEDIQEPIYVTEHIEQDNANGSQNETSYLYGGAQYQTQGKGFLGYAIFDEYDAAYNKYTFNTFSLSESNSNSPNGVYYDRLLTETSTKNTLTSFLIDDKQFTNSTIYQPANTIAGSSIHFNYVSQVIDNDALNGIQNNYTYTVDANGNQTEEVATNSVQTSTVTCSYSQSTNEWVPDNLSYKQTTVSRSGAPGGNYSRYFSSSYNNYGQITQRLDDIGIETDYTYDDAGADLGNLLSVTIQGGSITPRTNSYDYEPTYGRFVIEKTNALNQSTQYTYDDFYGNVLSERDPNGLNTRYAYDGFGRLIKTTTPTGEVILNNYYWDNSSGINNSLYYTEITELNAPTNIIYYDELGKKLRTQTSGFDGTFINVDQTYNDIGYPLTKSEPYYEGTSGVPPLTTYQYDSYRRNLYITDGAGTVTSYTYNYGINSQQYTVTPITGAVKNFKKTFDASKLLIQSSDDGGVINYTYASCGKIAKIIGNGTITASYDSYGRETTFNDPDAGTVSYLYDELDEINFMQNANQKGVTSQYYYTYDQLGRVVTTTESASNESITNTYDNQPHGIGMIVSSQLTVNCLPTGSYSVSSNYSYDNLSRVASKTENINSNNYTTTYLYDALNHITQIQYPTSTAFTVNRKYNSNGYLESISTPSMTNPIWQCTAMTERNQILSAIQGNNGNISNTYDNLGVLTNQTAYEYNGNASPVQVMNYNYTFNDGTGDLMQRSDVLLGLSETFTYDNLDRLTSITGPASINIGYMSSGNINQKTDIASGDYAYSGTQPHAVSSIESPNSIAPSVAQTVTYTPFNKASTLKEGPDAAGDNYLLQYFYGPDHQRRMSVLYNNLQPLKTIIYSGCFESITNNNTGINYGVSYIYSDNGLVAMNVTDNNADNLNYVHTDHLGSILSLWDKNGSPVYAQSFDAWGNYRSTSTWSYVSSTAITAPDWLIRGYTGHEHLLQYGLINMNGRIYDPLVGRMLSPDNYIQLPNFSQSFNRYSYCINNPLRYTDLTGNLFGWDDVAAAVIGGCVNVFAHLDQITAGGGFNWGKFGEAFAVGAVGGLAAYYTGGAALAVTGLSATSIAGGAVMGFAATAVSYPVMAAGNNAFFGDKFSLRQYGIALGIGTFAGAAFVGVANLIHGNNFTSGLPLGDDNVGSGGMPVPGSSTSPTPNPQTSGSGYGCADDMQMATFGNNPAVNMDQDAMQQYMLGHSFSSDRFATISNLSNEDFASNCIDVVQQNQAMLMDGTNVMTCTVNGYNVSIRVFVQDGTVLSVNAFPGISGRVFVGGCNEFVGNFFW